MRDTGPPPTRQRGPRKNAIRLGKEIYQRDILPQVASDHFSEYDAIDVDSGNWVVADREIAAAERLRTKCPGAVNVPTPDQPRLRFPRCVEDIPPSF